ncbi:hypothetical protein ABZX12_40840 [Kribbella sp. NPDC003505]|uniref:hypothetical protein n=1 Tax=Kribbella sp. NPDC003505 TaxID=3154448 RepID=UPI0033B65EED
MNSRIPGACDVKAWTEVSMDYVAFDSARREAVRGWWRAFTDPEELAAAVDRLQDQAAAIDDEVDRARAYRYLKTLDDLVSEARAPECEPVRRAEDVLLGASRLDGTSAGQG